MPAPLIVIVGPTAVGKTDFALRLAGSLQGEIVSADSRLFYRGMDIGTAKPTRDELARIPHHLINVADPDETWSLALFQQRAREAIEGIFARDRLPFLVGGTGQYVRAVTQAWTPPEVQPEARLRAVLEDEAKKNSPAWLHARLAHLDPAAASLIDSRNLRRTVRALEVILTTGQPFSRQRTQGTSPYEVLIIGLSRPRSELYARIDARIEAMFEAGLLEEVRTLLARGFSPQLPSMSGIGYRECCRVLQGELTEAEARMLMRRATRAFVRRQSNWFKSGDPSVHWFEANMPDVLDKTISLINAKIRA